MAASAEVRAQAELLYILQRKTPAEIATLLGVSAASVRRWREDEGWDSKVVARAMSGPLLAQECLQQINLLIEAAKQERRALTPEEVNRISQLQKVADRNDGTARFKAHAIDTMDRFLAFASEHAPDLHAHLVPVGMAFIRRVVDSPVV